VDWRADFGALTYQFVDTPPEIENGLRAYMDKLGLAYAAFDFAIVTDEHAWFLESNGSGQYGWLETQTGEPITAALADLLTVTPDRQTVWLDQPGGEHTWLLCRSAGDLIA
jgi:hypothetical protein